MLNNINLLLDRFLDEDVLNKGLIEGKEKSTIENTVEDLCDKKTFTSEELEFMNNHRLSDISSLEDNAITQETGDASKFRMTAKDGKHMLFSARVSSRDELRGDVLFRELKKLKQTNPQMTLYQAIDKLASELSYINFVMIFLNLYLLDHPNLFCNQNNYGVVVKPEYLSFSAVCIPYLKEGKDKSDIESRVQKLKQLVGIYANKHENNLQKKDLLILQQIIENNRIDEYIANSSVVAEKPFFLKAVNQGLQGVKQQRFGTSYKINNSFGFTYTISGEDGTITLLFSRFTKNSAPGYFKLMYTDEDGFISVPMVLLACLTLGIGAIGQAIYYGLGKMEAQAYARSVVAKVLAEEDIPEDKKKSIRKLLREDDDVFREMFDSIISQDILKKHFETNQDIPPIRIVIGKDKYLVKINKDIPKASKYGAEIQIFKADEKWKEEGSCVYSRKYFFNATSLKKAQPEILPSQNFQRD